MPLEAISTSEIKEIKGTLQTAARLVSWLPNNSMEKDPGDFRACTTVSCPGCGFKL